MSDEQPIPRPGPASRPLPAPKAYYPSPVGYNDLDLPPYGGDDELNLRSLWRIARRRRWMIAGIALIVTTLVTIDVYRTKPRYESIATIEIGQQSGAIVNGGEILYQEYDPLSVTLNTSEVVLTSAPMLEDVVVQLRLDESPAFLEVSERRSVLESLNEIAGKIQQDDAPPAPRVFTGTVVKTPIEADRIPEEIERLAPYVGIIEDGLRVRPIPDTRVMTVAFTHTDASIAAAVPNAIAERFVETSFDKKIEGFANASEWLDRSTRELKAKIEVSEQSLADYMRTHNIYALEGRETLIIEKLSALHDQATRAATDRILKDSLYEQVRQGRVAQIPEAFADPQTAELQRGLGQLSIRAAELGTTYGPSNPLMIEVNRQMTEIRDQIAASRTMLEEKLRADYGRAVLDETALATALGEAKTEAAEENQNAIQYSLLSQDVETSKALYTEFLQKTNQAYLEVAQQQSNIRVIAPARVPSLPVSPNRPRTILMGLMVSLFGGMGLAWALERFNDSIRSVDDVMRLTQLPALAVIPSIKKNHALLSTEVRAIGTGRSLSSEIQRGRIMELDGRSPSAEAYRALRTGLLLSTAGSPPKTILVTSVRKEEGKTTTATNTAISLAQLGGSVLLVDADLRKPSIHDIFTISANSGLSNYLAGNLDASGFSKHSPIDNLSVIPAGPLPPNPAELLSSDRMKVFLEKASGRYDHVILDSPPMGSVTDPVVLSTMVDGVILVVHGAKNSRQAVQRACHELAAVGAKIFGIVLNNVDLKREGYEDYYYYSSYERYGDNRKTGILLRGRSMTSLQFENR